MIAKLFALMVIAVAASQLGCRDNTPEVPPVPPPAPGRDTYNRDYEPRKPLPPEASPRSAYIPQPDAPPPQPGKEKEFSSAPPADFLRVYRDVGRPRLIVIANRSLEGQLLTVHDAATVRAPALEAAPKPGDFDASIAQKLDLARFEGQLSNWLSNDAQITIVPSAAGRESLSETQTKDLEAGKPDLLSDIGEKLKADILIQIQARPLRSSSGDVRLVAAAIDIRRREALTRASVVIHLPLDAAASNESAHTLANELMDGMANTWMAPASERPKSILER